MNQDITKEDIKALIASNLVLAYYKRGLYTGEQPGHAFRDILEVFQAFKGEIE